MWRPEVTIEAPQTVEAGQTLTFAVRVAVTTACEIRRVVVRLHREIAKLPATGQSGFIAHRVDLVTQTEPGRVIAEPTELRFAVAFAVPETADPTYDGFFHDVRYFLIADVDLVRRLDGRASVPVVVTARRGAPAVLTPALRVAPVVGAPFLEVAVSSMSTAPGKDLRGVMALSEATAGGYLELSLVGHEGSGEAHRHTEMVPVRALDRGEPFRFALHVPRTFSPTFHGDVVSLSWALRCGFDDDRGRLDAPPIPLTLEATTPQTSTEVPPVGKARWSALFADTAQETSLATEDHALVGTHEGVGLRFSASPEGIACSLRWADLGLSLSCRHERSLGRQKLVTKARFGEHARAIEGDPALVSMLRRFAHVGLTDTGGELVLAESHLVPGRLREAVIHTRALVSLLYERVWALPPPPAHLQDAELLADLAKSVDGRLLAGGLVVVDPHLDGEPFSLRVLWTGADSAPAIGGLRVGVPCFSQGHAGDLASARGRVPTPAALVGLSNLQFSGGELTADIPFPRPLRGALAYVRFLIALVREIGGGSAGSGPYR